MDMVANIEKFIEFLKKYPFDTKRKLALNLLERLLRHLRGELVLAPTKNELSNIVDVIKEFKQEKTLSNEEYKQIEQEANFMKLLIEWGYNFPQEQNKAEVSENDI